MPFAKWISIDCNGSNWTEVLHFPQELGDLGISQLYLFIYLFFFVAYIKQTQITCPSCFPLCFYSNIKSNVIVTKLSIVVRWKPGLDYNGFLIKIVLENAWKRHQSENDMKMTVKGTFCKWFLYVFILNFSDRCNYNIHFFTHTHTQGKIIVSGSLYELATK